MPAQIDYSKRGWLENIIDPGAWRNLLSDVSEIATETVTSWERVEKSFGSQPLVPSYTPKYPLPPPPPATLHDLGYSQKEILVIAGCGILLLFLLLKK